MAGPMQRVRAVRGFRHQSEVCAPGSVLDLEKSLAIELRTCNKVEFVQADAKKVHNTELPLPTLGREVEDKPKPAKSA